MNLVILVACCLLLEVTVARNVRREVTDDGKNLDPENPNNQFRIADEDVYDSTYLPIYEEEMVGKYGSGEDIIEGDIKVPPVGKFESLAQKDEVYRWPKAIVPFGIETSYTKDEKTVIAKAMLEIETQTHIKFVPDTHRRHIWIAKKSGTCTTCCLSYVGMIQQWSRQQVTLGSGCVTVSTIQHELMHALGFWHEHNHPDRDNFIRIHWDNIQDNQERNFNTMDISRLHPSVYRIGYDSGSVMHYISTAFGKTGSDYRQLVTMEGINGNTVPETDGPISKKDVQKLNTLYRKEYAAGAITIIPRDELNKAQSDGHEGSWGFSGMCPEDQFVYGYRIRTQAPEGDNTGLNDIELQCAAKGSTSYKTIYSKYAEWGKWSEFMYCSGTDNPVVGFDMLMEPKQGSGDDTAANAMDLYCKDGGYISASKLTERGTWIPAQNCPTGKAVVGIVTRVLDDQGEGDDTALNGVRLFCRKY